MGNDVVVQDQQCEIDPYAWMDQQDDQMTIAELTGRIQLFGKYLEKNFYYKFGSGKNEVVGLSKSGINECVRQLQSQGVFISEVGFPQIQTDPTDDEYVLVMVTCEKFKFVDGKKVVIEQSVGCKRQWIYEEIYEKEWQNGKMVNKYVNGKPAKRKQKDKFFFEKAKSKASRNAKSDLVSFAIRVKVLENAMAISEGVVFQPPQQQQRQPPPRQLPKQQPKQLPEPERLPDFNDKCWSQKTLVPERFLAPSMKAKGITFWIMATDNETKFVHNNGNSHSPASWLHVANYHGTEWEAVFEKTVELRKWYKAKQAEKAKQEQEDAPPWIAEEDADAEQTYVENM